MLLPAPLLDVACEAGLAHEMGIAESEAKPVLKSTYLSGLN